MREENDEVPDGTVLREFRRGFRLAGKLLRAAMVQARGPRPAPALRPRRGRLVGGLQGPGATRARCTAPSQVRARGRLAGGWRRGGRAGPAEGLQPPPHWAAGGCLAWRRARMQCGSQLYLSATELVARHGQPLRRMALQACGGLACQPCRACTHACELPGWGHLAMTYACVIRERRATCRCRTRTRPHPRPATARARRGRRRPRRALTSTLNRPCERARVCGQGQGL